MNAVIALAWPFVVLVIAAATLRAIGRWRKDAVKQLIQDLSADLARAHTRCDELTNLAHLHGTSLIELKRNVGERLQKVEGDLKIPPPPASRHSAETLAKFGAPTRALK